VAKQDTTRHDTTRHDTGEVFAVDRNEDVLIGATSALFLEDASKEENFQIDQGGY
jgi:hypothetical protein